MIKNKFFDDLEARSNDERIAEINASRDYYNGLLTGKGI